MAANPKPTAGRPRHPHLVLVHHALGLKLSIELKDYPTARAEATALRDALDAAVACIPDEVTRT